MSHTAHRPEFGKFTHFATSTTQKELDWSVAHCPGESFLPTAWYQSAHTFGSQQCTTASVGSPRCSCATRINAPRPLRHTLTPGKYFPMECSLYVAPSSFDGAQPSHVPTYGGPVYVCSAETVRATYGCFARALSSAASSSFCRSSSLQVAPASFVCALFLSPT